MGGQPTGTVTLLFTDIEGSTRLLERLGPGRYRESLELHRRLLREAFARCGGYEVDCEGDAFFIAFSRAADAVAAAAEAQQALASAEWPEGLPVRVRMGIHTGAPLPAPPKYVGLDVHKAARIMAAGHGGQVLVSSTTQKLLGGRTTFVDLGEHRLKDLSQPEPLYQLRIDGIASEFPALKTLGSRPNNLPVLATQFIGREQELAQVRSLVLREDVRLLTLTGPGGIGKTRLALQCSADLLDAFPSGVFWVALAPVRDPYLVVSAIAQALAVREEPGERILETLSRYLAEKSLLLVLDNLEHVIDAAPEIASILQAAANLRVLVTSREALQVQGEHLVDVPPLALPETDDLASAEAVDAMQLFATRARAADSEFAVSPDNVAAVAAIVRRLDGIPLALELAAARVRELPPKALLRRLDDRLQLLSKASRDVDERQRTLRAAIGWSYDLLSPEEQMLFSRLAVFVGGCRLDAAEAVCDHDRTLRIDVLDGVTSLMQKSLLRRRLDADGEPRYWMLETIREYASRARQLSNEPFTDFYAALSQQVEQEGRGWDYGSSVELFERDYANFIAAFDAAYRAHDALTATTLAMGLFYHQLQRDTAATLTLMQQALELERRPQERGWLLAYAAAARWNANEADAALLHANEAALVAAEAADRSLLSYARMTQVISRFLTGDAQVAVEDLERAHKDALAGGDPYIETTIGYNLATLYLELGRHRDAEQLYTEIQARCETSHVNLLIYGLTRVALGKMRASQGDTAAALHQYVDVLQRRDAIYSPEITTNALDGIAEALLNSGTAHADLTAVVRGAVDEVVRTTNRKRQRTEQGQADAVASQLRQLLPSSRLNLLLEQGRQMDLTDVVGLVASVTADKDAYTTHKPLAV